MTDAFTNLVGPIFQHLIEFQLRLGRGESPRLEPERDKILSLLEAAEQGAGTAGPLAAEFQRAKPALVYWIDEMLVNAPWGRAPEWREQILEWQIYQERLRADRFFERAQEAEGQPGSDALETYFLCVALGFRGMYADNRPGLLTWAERAYARIAAAGRQPDRFLPDDPADAGRPPLRPLGGRAVLLVVSVLVSATALLTLVGFLLAMYASVS
jgi:type VI secretion system protein ImpK